jgi:hypothetical protein
LAAFFAFFFVAIDLFSLPLFMDSCNGQLLQLIDCIESMKSDVKEKMTVEEHSSHEPKSHQRDERDVFF